MTFCFSSVLLFANMKAFSRILFLFILLATNKGIVAQNKLLDSLHCRLRQKVNDTIRVDILNALALEYTHTSVQVADLYVAQATNLAESLSYQKGLAISDGYKGIVYFLSGRQDLAMQNYLKALAYFEEKRDIVQISRWNHNIAGIFFQQKNYGRAIEYSNRAIDVIVSGGLQNLIYLPKYHAGLSMIYLEMGNKSKALDEINEAFAIAQKLNDPSLLPSIYHQLGSVHLQLGKTARAKELLEEGLFICKQLKDYGNMVEISTLLSDVYFNVKSQRLAFARLVDADTIAKSYGSAETNAVMNKYFAQYYKKTDRFDSALSRYEKYVELQNELVKKEKSNNAQAMEIIFQSTKKDRELLIKAKEIGFMRQVVRGQNRLLLFSLLCLVSIIVWAFMLYRINRIRKEANEQLLKLNNEVSAKNQEILFQSEKMKDLLDEISSMNENLERLVEERTVKLKTQNEKLINYAFLNSHKLRGPLARILGITNLLSYQSLPKEASELNGHLQLSAQELDTVVREISRSIETDDTDNLS